MSKLTNDNYFKNWIFEKNVEEMPSNFRVCKYDKTFYYPPHLCEEGKNPEPRPGTRLYEVNNIFKDLVHYSFNQGLYEENGDPIVNPRIKKDIIKYVFEHSKHN